MVLEFARNKPTVLATDKYLYVIGGTSYSGQIVSSCEIFDLENKTHKVINFDTDVINCFMSLKSEDQIYVYQTGELADNGFSLVHTTEDNRGRLQMQAWVYRVHR